jgi:hypothetical protein
VNHHAKAPSAGSTQATGNSRGLLRRAFAPRGALGRSKGTGAPSSRRATFALLAAIATIASLAFAAAPASAAPLAAKMEAISSVSYTTAHAAGKLTSPGCSAFLCGTSYTFEYSKDPINDGWTPGPGGFIGGFEGPFEDREIFADFENLEAGTEYFVRLVATLTGQPDPVISPAAPPYPNFTTLTASPPTIPTAVAASGVFSTSATGNAEVNRPADSDNVKCHFEYVTDDDFIANGGFQGATVRECTQNPIEAAGTKAVSAPLGCTSPLTEPGNCLSPNTTYHLRLAAENAAPGVVTKEAASTFTTLAPVAKPVVIAAENATNVTIHEATLKGEVQRPAGADPALNVECHFEYVTDAQFTSNPPGEEFAGATPVGCMENPITEATADLEGKQTVSAELSGLVPDRTYHVRLVAENAGGTDTKDAAATFTTLPAELPTVTIDPVAGGTYTTAHLSGHVQTHPGPHGGAICLLQISTDHQNWSGIERTGPGECDNAQADFSSLLPNTTYFLRIIASYTASGGWPLAEANGEVAFSPEETITTEPLFPPTAQELEVKDISATTAHLSATVDPHAPVGPLNEAAKKAFATHWEFVCTPECKDANGNKIGGTIQGEDGDQLVFGDVKRLEPGTEYTVSLIVSSEGGGETKVETFDTLQIPPTVKQSPGASDGKGGYVLQGIVNPNNQTVTGCEFKWGPDAPAYAFSAPCSPLPTGVSEKQRITARGQFKLSFDGESTSDIPFGAQESVVQAELESLSSVGPSGVSEVTRTFEEDQFGQVYTYEVTFSGPLGNKNLPPLEAENETVTTLTQGGANLPITVEAHLTGLNPNVDYHALLVVTYGAGAKAEGVDQKFVATLSEAESCPANEQIRVDNNSLALPECRAYEMVTPPGKEGFDAILATYDEGDRVRFNSGAGNIARSGQGLLTSNYYVAARSAAGWETIPNLNGSSGSLSDAPSNFDLAVPPPAPIYSADLLSSVWFMPKRDSLSVWNYYLRGSDGIFTLLGKGGVLGRNSFTIGGTSDDLSHLFITSGGIASPPTPWGPGVYEFLGTGNEQPTRRVDVDNSASPISTCGLGATSAFNSTDGRVALIRVLGGCGGANPSATELWARIDGTTSINVAASQCERSAADPGGVCNAPVGNGDCSYNENSIEAGPGCRGLKFQAATPDGSRIFFTTKQQLLDADTDQTNDLYACDIPSGTPAPVGKANPCAALRQVSAGDPAGAAVESVGTTSEGGSTALFTAKGVLADNEDAFKEKAVAGDHNLYVWRTDASHPDGQTRFVGRLSLNDLTLDGQGAPQAQSTPDGRYLVFTTASQLLDTDTDTARDVYRYDTDSGVLTRASTNVFGVAGNGNAFPAAIDAPSEHNPTTAISDDGTKIVFTTSEALSAADGNGEPDVYLWTPNRVSLISPGAVGGGASEGANIRGVLAAITGSGQDIYFQTPGALTPADGDDQVDVYDARIGGGFSFAKEPPCLGAGGACQSHSPGPAPTPAPVTAKPPADPGNVKPKTCPKGKVRKKNGKCVKKPKKHTGKKHHGKKASHKQGGGR